MPFGCSTSTSVADRELGERALEGRVAKACAEPEHVPLGRRGDDGDMPPRPFVVLVGRVEQLDPEVLAGGEVDLLPLQVEDDEQRALRDLALLLDERPHWRSNTQLGRERISTRGHPRHDRCLRLGARGVPRRSCARPRSAGARRAAAPRRARARIRLGERAAAAGRRSPRRGSATGTTRSWRRPRSCGSSSTGRTTASASASARARELAPEYRRALPRARSSTRSTSSRSSRSSRPRAPAALLCVERDPEACHRSLIAERLYAEFGLEVVHLRP